MTLPLKVIQDCYAELLGVTDLAEVVATKTIDMLRWVLLGWNCHNDALLRILFDAPDVHPLS